MAVNLIELKQTKVSKYYLAILISEEPKNNYKTAQNGRFDYLGNLWIAVIKNGVLKYPLPNHRPSSSGNLPHC